MTYTSLSEYLVSRHKAEPSSSWGVLSIILLTATLLAVWPARWLAWGLLAAGLGMLLHKFMAFKQAKRGKGSVRAAKWHETLVGYANARQLEARSHPELIPALENCARYRLEIERIVHGPEWQKLCSRAEWAKVRETVESAAEALLQDAIWASRPAFRPLGTRKASFAKLCEDPGFAVHALETVRLRKSELASLLDEVMGEPFMRPGCIDALARAQEELRSLREAEYELRLMSD